MIKSPMFSAAAETTTPPQTSSLAAPRPSPPGPASPASLWLHNHAYHRHRSAHRALRQSADAKLTVPAEQVLVPGAAQDLHIAGPALRTERPEPSEFVATLRGRCYREAAERAHQMEGLALAG